MKTRKHSPRRRKRRSHVPSVLLCLGLSLLTLLLLAVLSLPWTGLEKGPTVTLPSGGPLRADMARLNAAFIVSLNQTVEEVPHDALSIDHDTDDGVLITNWRDMAAVAAVADMTLDQVFAEMVSLHWSTELTDQAGSLLLPAADGTLSAGGAPQRLLQISVQCRSAGQTARELNLTQAQKRALTRLLDSDGVDWPDLLGGTPNTDAERILAALPVDLPPLRRAFVEQACGLVGRVRYFWGGKSGVSGWDIRWGSPALVVAPGISESGTVMPYGLDCSGLVSWTAVTATGRKAAYQAIGDGVRQQSANAVPISFEEALPGDLVFFPDLSHVGIVTGRNEAGGLCVVHCAHSKGGVVLGEDAAVIGFTTAGRPVLFSE